MKISLPKIKFPASPVKSPPSPSRSPETGRPGPSRSPSRSKPPSEGDGDVPVPAKSGVPGQRQGGAAAQAAKAAKRKQDEDEEDEPKGVIELKRAVKIVDDVLNGGHEAVRAWFRVVPLAAVAEATLNEILAMGTPEEQIRALMIRNRMKWRGKRKAEKLKVPGVYPNGEKKRYVMRRLGGAGYGVPSLPQRISLVPLVCGGLRERSEFEKPLPVYLVPA